MDATTILMTDHREAAGSCLAGPPWPGGCVARPGHGLDDRPTCNMTAVPCVRCRTTGGRLANGLTRPRRCDGARFGRPGPHCENCFKTVKRQHAGRRQEATTTPVARDETPWTPSENDRVETLKERAEFAASAARVRGEFRCLPGEGHQGSAGRSGLLPVLDARVRIEEMTPRLASLVILRDKATRRVFFGREAS
jgi:hypothetical protein